ncbi:hypothetical protein [Vogesella indigofera]|uniref:hypothetical protein n=1 Tax=Vogesella indigofera TaxID=45465 RepID=UPI00234F0B24|nr:hypothetical protein [Vogesella indigofera]MDC7707992.1 hypothetical protein [Vogesella indigofera]
MDQHIGRGRFGVLTRIRQLQGNIAHHRQPDKSGKGDIVAQLGVMRRIKRSKQALDFRFPTRDVFKARQNVIFFALLQIVYIDSDKHDPDNPYSLGCSNCFLIVSPLFLLCRLGAGVKPRAIFLPVFLPQQNQTLVPFAVRLPPSLSHAHR